MIEVFGDKASGNCMKVKYVADLLAIPYQWIDIDIMKGESRTPEFLAMSAQGQVPIIRVDGQRVLGQSNAIMLYLAEGSALIPRESFDHAKMMEWLFWEQNSHEPFVAGARFQRVYLKKRASEMNPNVMIRAKKALDYLNHSLTDRDFLLGSHFTIADIALFAYSHCADEAGFTLADFPAMVSWIERVQKHLSVSD
jgi:glutathione S-transferase